MIPGYWAGLLKWVSSYLKPLQSYQEPDQDTAKTNLPPAMAPPPHHLTHCSSILHLPPSRQLVGEPAQTHTHALSFSGFSPCLLPDSHCWKAYPPLTSTERYLGTQGLPELLLRTGVLPLSLLNFPKAFFNLICWIWTSYLAQNHGLSWIK